MHRQTSGVPVLKSDLALVRLDQTDDDVEGGGLARAIGPQQSNNFAGVHADGDPVDDTALAIFFDQLLSGQQVPALVNGQSWRDWTFLRDRLGLYLGCVHAR